MHSTLAIHLHDKCVPIIQLFEQCHQDQPIGKFFGKCNRLKRELSKCLEEETKERRRENREKALKKKIAFEKSYRDYLMQENSE